MNESWGESRSKKMGVRKGLRSAVHQGEDKSAVCQVEGLGLGGISM